jgi:hypothetical protein
MAEPLMPIKRVLCPKRLRRVPTQFSWIDQRLVRERHIERCDASALALYLLLLTVADAQGLSYYSDGTAGRLLSMTPQRLAQARADLIRTGFIAYQTPIYQVLSLEPREVCASATAGSSQGEPGLQPIREALVRVQGRWRDRTP